MNTISENRFVDFMSEALPELISSVMREDKSAVTKGRISVPQFWALHYIAQQEGLRVTELSAVLHRSKSSTSGLLRRLEKNSLVKRVRNVNDQRVVHITLTAKGRRLVDEIIVSRKRGIYRTYASLTPTERTRHMQMIKKILKTSRTALSGVLILLLLPFSARAQQTNITYSLAESIQIGLKRSLTVANAARQLEIAAVTKKRAIAEVLPKIDGIADYSLYDADNLLGDASKSVGAEASWQLFSGGRTVSAIRAAKAYQKLTLDQERRIKETQVRDIALSYYRVQLAKAQVEVLIQSVKQLTDFEADTRKKYEAGTVSEFNWLSAKVSLANEKPRLIAAENEMALAKEQFRNLTYIDTPEFKLSDPLEFIPLTVNLDAAIALGLRKRPDLLEKAGAVALRKEDISQQKSDYYPRIDFFANYNYQNPDPYSFVTGQTGWQDHWATGIRARWNLFDGGTRRANLGESQLMMAIEEDQLRDMERSVTLDIRSQWLRGRDAAEVIEATSENIDLATRALEIARARFNAGLSTNLEVTQANLELSDARLSRSLALYEYMVAVTSMKHAVGILLEEYE